MKEKQHSSVKVFQLRIEDKKPNIVRQSDALGISLDQGHLHYKLHNEQKRSQLGKII